MNDKISQKSNLYYSKLCQNNPFSHKGVSWGDEQSQYLRFADITKHISLDSSVLEIGCGNASFYKFLNFLGFRGTYTGFDINEDLLNEARAMYPNINVQKKNIQEEQTSQRADFVTISGVFNIDFGQDKIWIEKFLANAFKLCEKKLIFNAISTYAKPQTKGMFYINPVEILDFTIRNLSSNVIFEHGNLPCDFTLCVNKTKDWQSINN